jgi:hypothetical protein
MGEAGRIWRLRADAARKQAEQCTEAASKRHALEAAASYDRLASDFEEGAVKDRPISIEGGQPRKPTR